MLGKKAAIILGEKTLNKILTATLIFLILLVIFKVPFKAPTGQVDIEAPSLQITGTPEETPETPGQVTQYATKIFGYVFTYEDKKPISSVSVYASKEEPLEKYLYNDQVPPITASAVTDSSGKYELLVMPGDTWVWAWSTTRYPEVAALTGANAVPSLPPQQPAWTNPLLNLYLRKVGNFSTIIENVGTYGTAGWKIYYDSANHIYYWNLEGNGTAAQAGQIYDLYRETGKYMYIQPRVSDEYLRDVIIKPTWINENYETALKDLRFLVISNPANYPIVVHDVPNSVMDDYLQIYGYIEAAYPLQLDVVLETETDASFTDGDNLLKIKVDDMRAKDFVGDFKNEFAQEEFIIIQA